jgi:hypothetical protein
MCAFLRYSAVGLTALLATAYVAVSAETGTGAFRPTVMGPAPVSETVVNRMNKADRELTIRNVQVPAAQPADTARNVPTPKEQKILDGCDPAFSPLTASARNNFANRCVV